MIDFMYQLLESMGHTHPLHPVATHIPMGMVIGGFIFALLSLKKIEFKQTAYYCFVLALVFLLPTIILGITDWLYRFNGVLNGLIISKMVFAATFAVLLSLVAIVGRKENVSYNLVLTLYALCFINAMCLGYIGGEIQYG